MEEVHEKLKWRYNLVYVYSFNNGNYNYITIICLSNQWDLQMKNVYVYDRWYALERLG